MTEYPIDQSNLPHVDEVRRDFSVREDGALAHCLQEQEIEQHYASNIQKNKLVQKDIRIAKKLQDEEDERNKIRSLEKQRQIEERDSEYARAIQEELRRKAEECQRREEEDKEIAKKLQELEQKEVERWSLDSPTRIQGDTSLEPNPADLLEWQIAELQLQSSDQLLQDEELARRLQEEEEKQLTTSRHQIQNEDFRAAQVAQDEEIAKYIQRQELESHRRSEEPDIQTESFDESNSRDSSSERRRRNTDQRNEDSPSHQVWQDSEGMASHREHSMQEKSVLLAREIADVEKQLVPKNIAEELDPTFKSKRKESQPDMLTGCSQECSRPPQPLAVPVDGFYDFMDDGLDQDFASPTKRHSDKWGRQKSREKKENCKQQ